jgi:fucose permease
MGYIADTFNMAVGFLIPLTCFLFICYFGIVSIRRSINN